MMKFTFLPFPAIIFSATQLFAQTFSNGSNLIPGTFHSGGVTGVTDMNNDGRDDLIIMDQSNHLFVAYQQAGGNYSLADYGTVSNEYQWGMCVGDIDNDGHNDVMCGGGYDGVHIININGPGSYALSDPENASIFMQACNFADINNDGWLDGFACHDDGESFIFKNNGTGQFIDGNDLIDYTIHPESDNSGNYGSVWSDFDRDGDIDCMVAKCRQFINNPLDPRRTNILLVNDGNNVYHDEAYERGLVNLQQSWTSDFADIDNDGDFDCLITTHSGTLEIHENNGFGYFTNITAGSGLEIAGFFLQAKMEDFDNDGFVDVLYAGGVNGYLHNNGNKTFTPISSVFGSGDTMHAFGIGDLNNDGWMDVYCNYGNQYVNPDNSNADKIFLNDGGNNNWIRFDLQGSVSNKGAVGAIVEIHGPWGVQIREIRAGESYGISNSFMPHFGIGANTAVDYAVIHWPAGGIHVIENPTINSVHEIIETNCNPPAAVVSANGSTSICTGGSVALNLLNAGGNFLWTNGATSNTIQVQEGGNYAVYVYDNTGCAASSNIITVQVVEFDIATITVDGETAFCEGLSVELIANEGLSYLWSNGAQSQVVSITEGGTYTVQVQGQCGIATSTDVEVVVFDAPDAPVVDDITIDAGGSATFTYNGNDVRWYDAADAVTPVSTGNSFTTPPVDVTTSYWVEDVITHGGDQGVGGKLEKESAPYGQYASSSGYYLRFDANEDVIIQSVKVYAASAGNRTIEVIDANSNSVASGSFPVSQGESVIDINLAVPQGTGYGLRCTNSDPQLWRDKNLNVDTPFAYPYDINGLVSITSTSLSGDNSDNYYYFFYDWHVVTASFECPGPRAEVQVIVTGINEMNGKDDMVLYPNPVSDELNVTLSSLSNGSMSAHLIDQMGKMISTRRWNYSRGENNYSIDVSELPAGIYQLRLDQKEAGTFVKRFIVE